ncbi:hypothetical protein [Nocardioides sp. W7]|uniref:hypothetical protein n=1 Tax=Nocardioides sp. W7 TaxID=2931390 RepID=UPI001FD12C43|nr:hypothetical protein [Nocardioides sp. W7]
MRRLLAALPLLALLLAGPAGAVPTGGSGPDTPGTAASVSPRSLAAGGQLRFTLSGFPAGEVVYVKIDDGDFCDKQGVHGACVVHQQRVGGDGRVSGSFLLPAGLPAGSHWLRFLASEELTDAQGNYLGVKGYTRRGGADFSIVRSAGAPAASPAPSGTTPSGPSDPSVPAASSEPPAGAEVPAAGTPADLPDAAVPSAGAVLALAPGEQDLAPTDEPTAGPAPAPDAARPEAEAPPAENRFPVFGAVGLAGLLAAAGALVLRARRSR